MKKLLMALFVLVSASAVHTFSMPFSEEELSTELNKIQEPDGLTDQEMEFWSKGDPADLKMIMWLRKDPRLNKKEVRPTTAPPEISRRELVDEALHRGVRTSDSEIFRNELEKKKAASADETPTFAARTSFRETVSEGGTPKFIRKAIPVALTAEEKRALKKKLKRINTLHAAMKHAQILNSNDASSEQIAANSVVTLSPTLEANKVLGKMEKRIKTKRQALLELNNAAINKHDKDLTNIFPNWETDFDSLVDYVTAFFKPATRKNESAKSALQNTKDAPIKVELTEKNWHPESAPRGGTPRSRPNTPVLIPDFTKE